MPYLWESSRSRVGNGGVELGPARITLKLKCNKFQAKLDKGYKCHVINQNEQWNLNEPFQDVLFFYSITILEIVTASGRP